MDKIFIKGLKVNAIIGILEHERQFEQPLVIDIEMEHGISACAATGDLSLSINYAQVSEEVSLFVRERKAYLLETLAEELCRFILDKFRPQAVTLSVMKTRAVLNTDGVGVQITRTREEK